MWLDRGDDGNRENVRRVLEYQRTKDQQLCNDLLLEFEPFIRKRCGKFFLPGQEKDDLLQEGRIGFYKAIRDYNPEMHPIFVAFATHCIKAQCISALKCAQRMKCQINYTAYSLNVPIYDDNPDSISIDYLIDEKHDAEREGTDWDCYRTCDELLQSKLTEMEYQVFNLWLTGYTYQDVAVLIRSSRKSVDNSLQRIRKKLGRLNMTYPDFEVQFLGFLREKEDRYARTAAKGDAVSA